MCPPFPCLQPLRFFPGVPHVVGLPVNFRRRLGVTDHPHPAGQAVLPQKVHDGFQGHAGGLGDVKVKKFLNRVLEETLSPIRTRRSQWEQDIPAVYEILKKGSETARETDAHTLDQVKAAMKINYFEDQALIAQQAKKFRK